MKDECDIKMTKKMNINKETDLRLSPSQNRDSADWKKQTKIKHERHFYFLNVKPLTFSIFCGKSGLYGLFWNGSMNLVRLFDAWTLSFWSTQSAAAADPLWTKWEQHATWTNSCFLLKHVLNMFLNMF